MSTAEPMNWQHRLYQPAVIGGWSAEVWNPMTKAWQRSGCDPHWPADYEAVAREWVELANEDQRERNAAVAAALAA
ncbi:MAG: hypothetical protein K2X49_14630 [Acetobacteraceae bacterium]|nr:hypothetical protein [Acetobacteraceae bacterium]